jgi:predicted MFS family arabinose efflux permease
VAVARPPAAPGPPSPLPLLGALAFLVNVDVRMMTPLLPTMAASLGASVTALGLAMTLYMLPYGLCQLVYGPLADRVGGIRVVRVAALGFGVGTLLTGLAPSVLALDLLRLLNGIFAAAVIPLTLTYIGDSVPYEARQGALGRLVAVMSVAQSLSAAIGGTVAHFVSWRVLYVGAGLVALVPALLLFRLPSAGRPGAAATRGWGRYAVVLRRPAARVLFVVVGLEGLFLWGGFTYLGAVAVARHGLDELEVGLLLAGYGVATLAAGSALARVRRHVPERALAVAGGLLKGGAYLLLARGGSVALFGVGVALLGLGYVALHTTLQTRATELVPEARSTAVAIFALCLFLGGAVGSAAFGPLVDAGWHGPFLLTCGLGLLALTGAVACLLGREPGGA